MRDLTENAGAEKWSTFCIIGRRIYISDKTLTLNGLKDSKMYGWTGVIIEKRENSSYYFVKFDNYPDKLLISENEMSPLEMYDFFMLV